MRRQNPFLLTCLVVATFSSYANSDPFPALDDLAEKQMNPVMGRVTAHMGARIDFDGYESGDNIIFERTEYPEESVWWTPPFLNGNPRQTYYRVFIMKTPETWTRATVAFMPRGSGSI
jgi:hypothetical protein